MTGLVISLASAIIVCSAAAIVAGAYDGLRHLQKKAAGLGSLNHKSRMLFRIVFLAVLAAGYWHTDWRQVVAGFAVCFSTFFLWFDPVFNHTIKKEWHFIGTTAEYDKWARQVFGRWAGKWLVAVEAVVILVAIAWFFALYR